MNRRTQIFKRSRAAEKVWDAYTGTLAALLPQDEVKALLRHARPGHEGQGRWRAIDVATRRIRKIEVEGDIF